MKKMYLLFSVLAIIILAGIFSGCSQNNSVNSVKKVITIHGATNFIAYHNKHKDLEIMVNNVMQANPDNWKFVQLGLGIKEKVLIGTRTASQKFTAHYWIKEPNGNKYDLYCFADDDIPALQRQNGNQIILFKVDFARRGFYQELCNQRAESVMQSLRENEK